MLWDLCLGRKETLHTFKSNFILNNSNIIFPFVLGHTEYEFLIKSWSAKITGPGKWTGRSLLLLSIYLRINSLFILIFIGITSPSFIYVDNKYNGYLCLAEWCVVKSLFCLTITLTTHLNVSIFMLKLIFGPKKLITFELLVSEVKVTQSCPILCEPMAYTVHGILQARILEWISFPFSRGSSQPRDRSQVSCIAGGFFTS